MKKTILFSLACLGLAVSMPLRASAMDSRSTTTQSISNITPTIPIAQYRRNNRRNDRQFNVYYRYRGNGQWILENRYTNRRQAEFAARRLEARGYRTYIQLSREVNRRFG